METIWPLLTHPFTLGLLLGLLIAGFIWKSSVAARGHHKREIRRLQEEGRELQGHLNTQLKLNAKGTDELQKELDALRVQNENLRVNIASLQNKPGRAEQRQYQISESAIRAMREQAPGFAPAWEQALRTAEADYEEAEGGLKKLVRKVIPGIGNSSSSSASAAHSAPVEVSVSEEKEDA